MKGVKEFTLIVGVLPALLVVSSPAHAYTVPGDFYTIQECLDAAAPGDTCSVAIGIYYENIAWPDTDGIILAGAGPGTIINGNASGPVVAMEGSHTLATAILDLTVANGFAPTDHGAGIRLVGASPTISNVMVIGNEANWYLDGAGIYVTQGAPAIDGCMIMENAGGYWGGGISIEECSGALVEGCLIFGNITASGYGIAYGAGIYVSDSQDIIIRNNIIVANYVDFGPGGGLAAIDSDCLSVNNTFSLNVAGRGGGIYSQGTGFRAINNILWGDVGEFGDDEIYVEYGDIAVTYSDVMGGWPGEGNIDADPLFVNPPMDFHLQGSSPCIDAGNNAGPGIAETDIDGEERIVDGDGNGDSVIDMGADEAPATGVCFIGVVM